jgi:mono/diheme cytochrome c family protein
VQPPSPCAAGNPDLHGLRKSDQRLEKITKDGIKGEMPAFGKKFSDADIAALIAFLRTLDPPG